MSKQNFANHVRYYPAHHFVFYPLSLALLGSAIYYANKLPEKKIEFYFFAAVIFLIIWLSFMLRQHYALTLQNRIVRIEMRQRYFELTAKRFDPIETKLSFGQISALRFASDEELIPLIDKTLKESLEPTAVKKLITNWRADHSRV